MPSSPLMSIYDQWTQPSYEVRVRETVYLWGSAGIKTNLSFGKPLVLHIRNDVFGVKITVGTEVAAGTKTPLGTLEPGEALSVPLQDISGVYATCDLESKVACLIKGD
jgi:hypothetical protein